MRREEIDRLLARLSSGELTPGERETLYNAALDDQALFEEIFAEQALAEALQDEAVRGEFLSAEQARESEAAAVARAVRRRIPWWGWAVPAAVAASTILGVFLVRDSGKEAQAAQTASRASVEIAKSAPESATQAGAPAAVAVPPRELRDKAVFGPQRELASSAAKAESATRNEAVSRLPAARSVAALKDSADERLPEKRKEQAQAVAGGIPETASPQLAMAIEGRATDQKKIVPEQQTDAGLQPAPAPSRPGEAKSGQVVAGRNVEAETRFAARQAAPAEADHPKGAVAAAPPPQAGSRADTAELARSRMASVPARKEERDQAVRLAAAAVLQVREGGGEWRDADVGRSIPRGAALRVKVTSPEDGVWELLSGNRGRTTLKRAETGYFELPERAPGAQAVELAFRPSPAAVQAFRTGGTRPDLGRVRISFTVE